MNSTPESGGPAEPRLRLVRPPTTESDRPEPNPSASPSRARPAGARSIELRGLDARSVDSLPVDPLPVRALPAHSQQGTLALEFPLRTGLPADPAGAHHGLRLASYRPRYARDEDDPAPAPTPSEELPDPRQWTARLVQGVVEALHGDRPLAQLLRWTSREVYDDLQSVVTPRPNTGSGTVARRRTLRPMVRTLHLSEPDDGVVEACATVQAGRRSHAVAVRIEGLDGRWLCTALELG